MPGGLSNKPKILRGAFVEFGISAPPLVVIFQFNPLSISRARTASVEQPRTPRRHGAQNLTLLRQVSPDSLKDVRGRQLVRVNDETLSFDIRLDATDKLDEGDALAEEFGIAPQLSTLELMMLPKGQGLLGAAGSTLLGAAGSKFSFADDAKNPPVILFVWGRRKVMPVNITGMQIKEEEFSFDLNPTRATVSVSLQVIEGPNAPYLYTKAMKEAMSLTDLANLGDLADPIVPA